VKLLAVIVKRLLYLINLNRFDLQVDSIERQAINATADGVNPNATGASIALVGNV
jgi:hypothetical protein